MMTFGSFLGQAALAGAALLAAVYLPGRLWVRALALRLDPLERLAAAWVSGMSLLVLVYWGLAWLGWECGIWLYVAACVVLELIASRRQPAPSLLERRRREVLSGYWPLGLLVLAAGAGQAWFMVFSGWQSLSGLNLYAWHSHDAPWHIYNLYQLSRTFPPEVPGFAGEILRNYHIFADLFWGAVLRLVKINPWHVYFRVAPWLYSWLLTLTTFVAARAWTRSRPVAYLAATATAVTSNFGYVMPLLFGLHKYFFWDSVFWVQSPFTMIFNPGVSASFGLVMFGLWALQRWQQDRYWGHLLTLALVWGVLPGFKVYAGLLVMGALLVLGAARLVFNRDSAALLAFGATLPVFLLVFLPPNLHAPSLVRFLPGFNLATMLVAPDRMALGSAAALKLLFAQRPLLVAGLLAALIPVFVVGNLGVRSLGLGSLARAVFRPRQADPLLLFLAALVAGALLAPVLFVQTGIQWNTIQFFYYAVLVMSLPAAKQAWSWLESRPESWRRLGVVIFIALGLPGSFQALSVMGWWGTHLTWERLEAFLWLKTQAVPGEVILRPLPDELLTDEGYAAWLRLQARGRMTRVADWSREARELSQHAEEPAGGRQTESAPAVPEALPGAEEAPPGPTEKPGPRAGNMLPAGWMDTAFVAALTLHNTYLEDTVSSLILDMPVAARVEAVREFYLRADVVQARLFLEKAGVTYVLLDADRSLPFPPAGANLRKIFSNQAMMIYKYIPPYGDFSGH